MSNNFDWSKERESVVVPSVSAVAVYLNEDQDVVIRQEDQMGNEDTFIVIPRMHAKAVVKAINELLRPPLALKNPAI